MMNSGHNHHVHCNQMFLLFPFLADFGWNLSVAITSCISASVPLCSGQFLMQMLHMWHLYAHAAPYMPVKYLGYMPILVGIFFWDTFGNTCEVEVVLGCVLVYIC